MQQRNAANQVRLAAAVACGLTAIFLCIVFNFLPESNARRVLVGRGESAGFSLLTTQVFIWMAFLIGVGELFVRFLWTSSEQKELGERYLPEEPERMLLPDELGDVVIKLPAGRLLLPTLIRRVCHQFQSTGSVARAADLLRSSLDLALHELELRYSMVRYLVWLLPTLGFIGTVVGISSSLGKIVDSIDDLGEAIDALAVAFDTTLLALVLSGVLLLIMNLVESREEMALNRVGQYITDNLLNRLIERFQPNRNA